MVNKELTQRQQEIYDAYIEFDGDEKKIREKLNINSISGLTKQLWSISKKKLITPNTFSPVAPVGWSSFKKTVQYNAKNEVIQTWDRILPDEFSMDLFMESFKERKIPAFPLKIDPPEQNTIQKDVAFVWPCVDMHVGLAAWKPETLDSNYDLKISKKLEDAATIEMLKKVGSVEHIHLAFLGDSTHTDNKTNMTPMSGNILDVDSRYDKIVWTARDIICNKIEQSLAYANTVSVDIVKGNHDPNTAVCMLMAIDSYYRNESRVHVNISPAQFKFFKWGISYAMGCHGHEAPPSRLASFLLNYVVQNSIKVKELYVYKANVHHQKKEIVIGVDETDGGVIVETFPTLTAKDGWHASKAFSSRRASIGKLFHKKHGLIDDRKINVKFLAYKYNIK